MSSAGDAWYGEDVAQVVGSSNRKLIREPYPTPNGLNVALLTGKRSRDDHGTCIVVGGTVVLTPLEAVRLGRALVDKAAICMGQKYTDDELGGD